MIDLSALGLSSVQTSHHAGKPGASHEHGKNAKSFGDLVDEAGKKHRGRNTADDDAGTLKAGDHKVGSLKITDKRVSDAAATLELDAGNATDAVDTPKLGTTDVADAAAMPKLDDENVLQDASSPKARAENPADAASRSRRDHANDLDEPTAPKTNGRHAADAVAMLKVGENKANDDATSSKLGKTAGADTDIPENDMATDADRLASDATNAEAAKPEGRVRLSAGLQQLMKSGAMSGVLRRADDAKDEVKGGKAENKQAQNSQKDDAAAVKDKTAASPSQELHALLGMAPARDDADMDTVEKSAGKPVKTSGHATDDDKVADAKPARAEHADDAAPVSTDMPAAQMAAAQHAAVKLPDNSDTLAQADADDGKAPADQDVGKLRLVSNDGKGRAIDIELAKPAGNDHGDGVAGGNTDFVTVLDSRRYLGFTADSSNAVALTNAVKAEPSWAQVIHNVKTGAGYTATEVNTLKLQMNPEHLGNMTASLRLKGDELSVDVRVETVDAYRQLSKDQDSIVKALKDQGFSIDQVSIQLSHAARSDGGQNSGQSSGQNSSNQSQSGANGQNLQQGGQGDNARQRDESARRSPNQNNWISNDSTSTLSDPGTGRNNTDAGNLYL
jgi:chemotaxis protein MotD